MMNIFLCLGLEFKVKYTFNSHIFFNHGVPEIIYKNIKCNVK